MPTSISPLCVAEMKLSASLELTFSPVIGSVPLADFTARHSPSSRSDQRNAKLAYHGGEGSHHLRAMLNWAVKRGDLDHNPAAGMDERVSKPASDFCQTRRLPRCGPHSLTFQKPVELALKLATETGQRIGGGVRHHWGSSLDGCMKNTWTIPAEVSKTATTRARTLQHGVGANRGSPEHQPQWSPSVAVW